MRKSPCRWISWDDEGRPSCEHGPARSGGRSHWECGDNKRKSVRKYEITEKGKKAKRKYNSSEKGREAQRKSDHIYRATLKGIQSRARWESRLSIKAAETALEG